MIQFKQEFFDDLELLVKLEDQLENSLFDADIDGHDVGNGELNIFIHTNDPTNTLEETKAVLENQDIDLEAVKVGYRDFSSNTYVPIWPEDLEEFKVT